MREQTRSRQRLETLASTLGPAPWTTAELLAHGWSFEQVRAAVRAGRLVRVRRGAYAPVTSYDHRRARLAATIQAVGPGAVLSHSTAGEDHGLWIPRRWQDGLVHLTKPGTADRRSSGVRIHGSRLTDASKTEIDGLPVTTPARTALDLARGGSLGDALIVMDSAARALISAAGHDLLQLRDVGRRQQLRVIAEVELRAAFDDVWTWPGTVIARAGIDLMDPSSESPAESRSRAWIIANRLPLPVVAFAVRGASGAQYVSDFAWPAARLLGEVDGFAKYGDDTAQVQARLRQERLRQDDLQDAGWRVVRWSSADPERRVVARIARALRE